MRRALLNGKTVEAIWVTKLPDAEFTKIKSEFICVGCKAHAYFNRGSQHQAPYFASKNHAEDCDEAYQGFSGSDPALIGASKIVIMVGGSKETLSETAASDDHGSGRRTTLSETKKPSEAATRRGVDAILKELIANPEFARSSKKIVVGKVETVASEFFVPFFELDTHHIDRPIGVWGEASFREGNAIVFLNRGDQKVDIRIPKSEFAKLKRLYNLTSDTKMANVRFLLIGTFNSLLECRVLDARQIALDVGKGEISGFA
jgi:hypothetical protein